MARKNGKTMKQNALPTGCTALYIRVSTDKQADEGYSLDAQRNRLEAYCAAMGWPLCGEGFAYVDAGLSGKTTERPAFQRMLQDAAAGRFQRVVSVALDRLARSTLDFLNTVNTLNKTGVTIVLLKENFDTGTPQGEFFITLLAAMAQLETRTISERLATGRIEKARQGGRPGATVPFGYDLVGGSFTPNGHAETVKRVYAAYLGGSAINRLADALNAENIPTATGAKWYPSTVSYILHNGFYAGLVQYDGQEVDGAHPALVSRATYEAVQAKLHR